MSPLRFVLPWVAWCIADRAFGQEIVREWIGTPANGFIGFTLASLPDLDGDGVPDVAFSTNIYFSPSEVRSGATGALLWTLPAGSVEIAPLADFDGDGVAEIGNCLGHGIDVYSGASGAWSFSIPLTLFDMVFEATTLPDLDGDGVDDLVLGVPAVNPRAPGPGEAKVRSGAGGAALFAAVGATTGDEFGSSVAPLPDIDGDGLADFAAGAPNGLVAALGTRVGYVFACSGGDGSMLWRFDGTTAFPKTGRALAPTGDFDGDGRDDLLVSSEGAANGAASGRITIVSSSSGSEIAHVDGAAGFDIGRDLADAGDADGDGMRDLLFSTQADQAWLVSGATLALLHSFEDTRGTSTGSRVAPGRDYDGDGRADAVLADPLGSPEGRVSIHRGNDLYLDLTPIEVTDGDTIGFTIRTGVPGNAALLALVEENGVSLFVVVGGILSFDPAGSIGDSDTVPPGLAGSSFTFQAFAIDAGGKLIRSDHEVVTVH